ncbi:MAG: phosphoribosylformylglycinamidine synthase subunit PurQ [Saprospiraceae bacterium]|jgi:phosphoribosylformylglycinamidine synthase I|nr:phosphoribosylformylglycinamidine synthase subunit PurQ [Candidatus Brachybacter algidus]MBK8746386.1 phosphoribosylformylglycinamidine synthase subunit PurQ [Candidatus Brachybacter algidus]
MKAGVVVFPGSNCDHDMIHALSNVMGIETREIWHKDVIPEDFTKEDWIVLPGGFSYGDYLRCGAIARFSNVMASVIDFANAGGKVLGVCNGFQILCESHLLPGVLLRNKDQKFICKNIHLRTETGNTILTGRLNEGDVLKIPIAHAEGRFHASDETLQELIANDQILFKYCDENGNINEDSNFNGALHNIAGICNSGRNVFGMMPHPERAAEDILGNSDGLRILEGLMAGVGV